MATHTRKSTNKKATTKKAPAPDSGKEKGNNSGKEFPGYPTYGEGEDITRNSRRIDENLDDEVLTQVKHHEEPKNPKDKQGDTNSETSQGLTSDDTDLDGSTPNAKSNFDVNDEDLEALGPKDLAMDMGDDEQLKHRTRPVDFAGNDLDVPGTELDDDQEQIGSEDEENNNYSLGGDKNNLEEGQ